MLATRCEKEAEGFISFCEMLSFPLYSEKEFQIYDKKNPVIFL